MLVIIRFGREAIERQQFERRFAGRSNPAPRPNALVAMPNRGTRRSRPLRANTVHDTIQENGNIETIY